MTRERTTGKPGSHPTGTAWEPPMARRPARLSVRPGWGPSAQPLGRPEVAGASRTHGR